MSGSRRHGAPVQKGHEPDRHVRKVVMGEGPCQIVRSVPEASHEHMTDEALLRLYQSPDPEEVLGARVDEIMPQRSGSTITVY